MIKVKRDKRSRIRGRRTIGFGSRKKHRGSGTRGGVGMAGTGKKAGQKRTLLLKYFPNYLGKKGFNSLTKIKGGRKVINLNDIKLRIKQFEKEGMVKHTAEGMELDLSDYKILGDGELEGKIIIKAQGFSEKAKEKIISKGGKALEK